MPFSATADVERFDEAADWFLSRQVATPEGHAELIERNSRQAFWIGAGLQLDQIQRVFDKIGEAIETGEPFDEWRKRVRSELTDDDHAETVFRNATQRAYNTGRWEQMHSPDVLQHRPYFLYDAILDTRTSDLCEECNGTLLPADDPWWKTRVPPLHHRCRSSIRNVRKSEADRLARRRSTKTTGPNVRPAGDWGKAPGRDEWKPDRRKYDKALGKELEKKAAKKLPKPLPVTNREREQKQPEPNPEPQQPTRHYLDEKAAESLLEMLDAPDGGVAVREWIRGALSEHIGATHHHPNNGLQVAPSWIGSNYAAAGVHPGAAYYGSVGISEGASKSLRDLLSSVAKGQGKLLMEGPLKTLLHEEVHMAAKATGYLTHKPWNRFIEEVTTELVAHRVADRMGLYQSKIGIWVNARGQSQVSRGTSYHNEIAQALSDVVSSTGWSPSVALEKMIDAGAKMRGEQSEPREYLDDFLHHLEATPDQKGKLRELLLGRTV